MCKDTRERKCFTLHRWKVAIRKMLEENAQQIELLSVEAPEIDHRTDQGNACIHLKTGNSVIMMIIIRGHVFDTTVSNTGLKTGACALLEQMHLVWTAHRHQVFEIMLLGVFAAASETANEGLDTDQTLVDF